MVFPAMSHFLSVEIRFAPLVVYDYSRLYIGFILFYIRMCIRHTEYIYMVCNLCFLCKQESELRNTNMLHVYSMLIGQGWQQNQQYTSFVPLMNDIATKLVAILPAQPKKPYNLNRAG